MAGRVKIAVMRPLGLLITACLALFLAVGVAALPGEAYAGEDEVRAASSGVFKFNWSIDGVDYSRGSCFLINEDTVITGYHCTFFSSNELALYEYSSQDIQDLKSRMTYSVTINRDVKVGATLINASEAQDFAIFKLDQVINNRTPLPIRESGTVKAAEQVYSIGFPANSDLKVINTYTADDATIKSGTVSKIQGIYQGMTSDLFEINGYYLQTNCPIPGGDSGGPMVDQDGNVVGISIMSDSNYYYAAATDAITPVLDDLGIEYTRAGQSTVPDSGKDDDTETTYSLSFTKLNSAIKAAEGLDSSKYTEDSYAAVASALEVAKEALELELDDNTDETEFNDKQAEIDEAVAVLNETVNGLQEAPQGLPMGAVIGIIVAVVAVIVIVIVVVVVMRGKKKKAGDSNSAPDPYKVAPVQPVPPAGINAAPVQLQPLPSSSGGRAYKQAPQPQPQAEAGETTILDEGETDTILLFQAASGGSLTRMSNNELIPINAAEFTIGRERNKVSYCLEGNSSISRVHVRILVRDGKVYLVDNRAANGTYVNGVKARPGQEILLKSGDIITLADEKFKYNS